MGDTQHSSLPPQPGKPLPSSNAVLAWDTVGHPGRVEGNLVPTCWLVGGGGVPCSRRCFAMSNSVLAAGSCIPTLPPTPSDGRAWCARHPPPYVPLEVSPSGMWQPVTPP